MITPRQRIGFAVLAGGIVAVVLVANLILSPNRAGEQADRSRLESVVAQYERSLERRDVDALASLAPIEYTGVVEEAREHVTMYGGRRVAELRHVSRFDDMTPGVANVDYSVESGPLSWTATFVWRDGSWKLLLGGLGHQADGPLPLE